MILQECLDKLARGKLSNLALSEKGKIKEESQDKVIDAINEALRRLYTTFNIKEKSVFVQVYEGRTDYVLSSEHSIRKIKDESIYNPYDYYIADTDEEPFEDDILSILEIYDEFGIKRPINDPDSSLGIMIPEENLIIVKNVIDTQILNVCYRAKHLLLTSNNLDNKIELPENLYGALLSYVAYLIHSDLNTKEAVENSQKYYMEYQNILNEVNLNGTLITNKLISSVPFIKRGWV